jgi:hypothetical protein
MTDQQKGEAIAIGFIFGLGALMGGIAAYGFKEDQWQKRAAKLGHAEWVTDDSGASKWRWKQIEAVK